MRKDQISGKYLGNTYFNTLSVCNTPANIITRAEVVSMNLLLGPGAERHCWHTLKSETWPVRLSQAQSDWKRLLQINQHCQLDSVKSKTGRIWSNQCSIFWWLAAYLKLNIIWLSPVVEFLIWLSPVEDFLTQASTWSIETSGSLMKFKLMDVGEANPSIQYQEDLNHCSHIFIDILYIRLNLEKG